MQFCIVYEIFISLICFTSEDLPEAFPGDLPEVEGRPYHYVLERSGSSEILPRNDGASFRLSHTGDSLGLPSDHIQGTV